jgi:threonine dehydratase
MFQNVAMRPKSSSVEASSEQPTPSDSLQYSLNEDGDCPPRDSEIVNFPGVDPSSPLYNSEHKPVLLNAKAHVVGYLSKILNARVYDAAIETELQHAKNLSAVS